MSALKIAVLTCSLFAATAYAQTGTPDATRQQVAQARAPQMDVPARHESAKPSKRIADCVGPVSFCNIYFGS